MATYFVSDVHGEYELFCRLLDKVRFCSADTLIVLGDFIDKGEGSVRLAKLIYSLPNIKAVCGNHEYSFVAHYESLMREVNDGDDINNVLTKLKSYFGERQEDISWELMDFLEVLPRYIESEKYICVHAGVQLDGSRRIIPLENQDQNTFIFDRRFAGKDMIPVGGKTVLFGHTPCHYQNGSGRIIKTPKSGSDTSSPKIEDFAKIQLDNGVAYTKMLGILRLEDMQEFYVSKTR